MPAGRSGVEELAAVWERRFHQMMDYVCAAHPYYRSLMQRLGLSRRDFGSLTDLRKLPVTTKQQYMADPDAFRLRSESLADLSLPERTLWGVVYTTGSTAGRPTPFYDTSYDHVARIWQMRVATEMAGITAADVVANCFPLTAVPHQGFLSASYGPLAVGARVLTGFTGRLDTPFPVHRTTEEFVRLIATHRATVLWGITSYVRRVVQVAETLRLDLSSVRIAFVAGEPCPPGMRADLRHRLASLGATSVFIQNGYGCTEMQGPTIECTEEGPLHVPAAEQYWFEVVDPTTHAPVPEGTRGLVLLSHLNRRGTVLFRYAIGDLSAMITGPCDRCGRDGPRFIIPPQRGDALVKVRGTLLNPVALIAAMSAVPGIDDFQVVVAYRRANDPLSGEELVIRFTAASEQAGAVGRAITMTVQDVSELTPRTLYLIPEEFAVLREADEYKFRRFRDERDVATTHDVGR
ncbi:MAG TPA: AMP-binding protein [bacterium]|nr:AMP-binding protein [bacterium]